MLEASCDSSTHSSRTLVIIYPGLYINVGSLTYTNDLMIQADPTHQLYMEIILIGKMWQNWNVWKEILICLAADVRRWVKFTLTVLIPLSMRFLGLFQLNWCSSEPWQQVTGWLNSLNRTYPELYCEKLWSSSHTGYPFESSR
jgi:hypothetical protein